MQSVICSLQSAVCKCQTPTYKSLFSHYSCHLLSYHLLACACVVADRIAWNNIDNYCVTLYLGDTPRKAGWGYAEHFHKLLPHLCPRSAIFATLFMNWPKIWYPINDHSSWYSYPEHELWRASGSGLFDNEKVASSRNIPNISNLEC